MACKRFGVLLVLLAAHLALVQGQNCDYTGPGLDDELAALGLSTDPNATWTGPLQTAQVGDVSFPYYIFGAEDSSGPTVVMITGFGTTMAEWGPVLPQLLAKESRVLMFDNPGQGHSTDTSPDPLTIESMADSIMGLLRDAGVATEDAKPVLLGWSMGGMVALSMAQQYGSELAGLVLADTAVGGPDMVFPDNATITALTCCNGEEATGVMFNLTTPEGEAGACAFLLGSAFMSEALGENYTNPDTSEQQAEATAAFEESSAVYDALPGIELPALVVQGAQDLIIPPQNAQVLADRLPQAQLSVYPDAGHGLWAQDTERFASEVNAFLKTLSSGGAPAPTPAAPAPAPTSAGEGRRRLGGWLVAAALALAAALC